MCLTELLVLKRNNLYSRARLWMGGRDDGRAPKRPNFSSPIYIVRVIRFFLPHTRSQSKLAGFSSFFCIIFTFYGFVATLVSTFICLEISMMLKTFALFRHFAVPFKLALQGDFSQGLKRRTKLAERHILLMICLPSLKAHCRQLEQVCFRNRMI